MTLIDFKMQSLINNQKENKLAAKERRIYRDYKVIATKCKRQGCISGERCHELSQCDVVRAWKWPCDRQLHAQLSA